VPACDSVIVYRQVAGADKRNEKLKQNLRVFFVMQEDENTSLNTQINELKKDKTSIAGEIVKANNDIIDLAEFMGSS